MSDQAKPGLDWAALPVIATVARLLCRELTLQNNRKQHSRSNASSSWADC